MDVAVRVWLCMVILAHVLLDLRLVLVVPHGTAQANDKSELPATEPGCAHGRPARIRWARLLKRVFEIDLEHCPNCGSQLKIIAAILEAPAIERILTHLGLQARAPPRAPAHGDLQQAA